MHWFCYLAGITKESVCFSRWMIGCDCSCKRVNTCWLSWTFSALSFSSRTLLHMSQWKRPSPPDKAMASKGVNLRLQLGHIYPLFSDCYFSQSVSSSITPFSTYCPQIISHYSLHLVHFPFDNIDKFLVIKVIIRFWYRSLILLSRLHTRCPFILHISQPSTHTHALISGRHPHFQESILLQLATYPMDIAWCHFQSHDEIFFTHTEGQVYKMSNRKKKGQLGLSIPIAVWWSIVQFVQDDNVFWFIESTSYSGNKSF